LDSGAVSKYKRFFDPDMKNWWISPPPSNPLTQFIDIEMGNLQANGRRNSIDTMTMAPDWAESILCANEENNEEE
jgi:hypothetical protein